MKLFTEIEPILAYMELVLLDDDLQYFINTSYENLSVYHFGLGTWIRNTLLCDDSYLYNLFVHDGVSEKDEISTLIICLFYLYLHE